MIKKDLVDRLYERHGGMSRHELERHTNQLIQVMAEVVGAEETLTITHFGKFVIKARPVREIVMPGGERRLSDSRPRLRFLPAPALKTFINAEEDA